MIKLENLKNKIAEVEFRIKTSPDIKNFTFAIRNVRYYMQDTILLELLNEALDNATMVDKDTGKVPCYEEEIKNFVEYRLNKLPDLIDFIKDGDGGQDLAKLKAVNEAIRILMGENNSPRKFKIKD
jgi:hypothetical protein